MRHLAHALVQRIDGLTDRWLAGTAPTPQQLDAAAEDTVVLRDLLAAHRLRLARTGPTAAPVPPVPVPVPSPDPAAPQV